MLETEFHMLFPKTRVRTYGQVAVVLIEGYKVHRHDGVSCT